MSERVSAQVDCMVACSIVGFQLDYCMQRYTVRSKLNHIIEVAARSGQSSQSSIASSKTNLRSAAIMFQLHWLLVEHRITHKTALLTYKVHHVQPSPADLNSLLTDRSCSRMLRLT